MREIKFRAWITDSHNESEMFYLDHAGLRKFDFEAGYVLSFSVDGYGFFYAHECYENRINKHELMQYTGLKDKNGKEIYEGDILGLDCIMVDDYTGKDSVLTQKLPVVWDNKRVGFTVFDPSSVTKGYWGYIPNTNAYVLGNKYENPDLLNEK
jgi:uncharacterized phage protein (TIGR01671 family)